MFWLLILPVSLAVICVIWGIIMAIHSNKWENFWGGVVYGFISLFVALILGLVFNSMGTSGVQAIATPDTDHPVYLVSLSGDETISGAFILASGSFDTNETYRYHYYLPGTNRIASGSSSRALIVEDNPEKPYYVEIKAVCPERNEFWTSGCNQSISYDIEFHVPTGSVVQQIQITP